MCVDGLRVSEDDPMSVLCRCVDFHQRNIIHRQRSILVFSHMYCFSRHELYQWRHRPGSQWSIVPKWYVPSVSTRTIALRVRRKCLCQVRRNQKPTCTIIIIIMGFIAPRGAGAPPPPLSLHFPVFCSFLPFSFLVGFNYFLLLSIPFLSTRIVPLRFQAGGRKKRPNMGLVCCVYFVLFALSVFLS